MKTEKEYKIGKMTFCVSSIKCSECGSNLFDDGQQVLELYSDMVEQSQLQHESQLDKYLDYYKRIHVCDSCCRVLIVRAKFTKIHNFVHLEAVTYPIERDCVWIATHTQK